MQQSTYNQHKAFINKVIGWIKGYNHPGCINQLDEQIRKFVDNSDKPEDVKKYLNAFIDMQLATIKGIPWFATDEKDGCKYLADNNAHIKVYTWKLGAGPEFLKWYLLGYPVELVKVGVFYRIKLTTANIPEAEMMFI